MRTLPVSAGAPLCRLLSTKLWVCFFSPLINIVSVEVVTSLLVACLVVSATEGKHSSSVNYTEHFPSSTSSVLDVYYRGYFTFHFSFQTKLILPSHTMHKMWKQSNSMLITMEVVLEGQSNRFYN